MAKKRLFSAIGLGFLYLLLEIYDRLEPPYNYAIMSGILFLIASVLYDEYKKK